MKFNFKNILRTFAVAFDVKKIWFELAGGVIALAGCLILIWLGALIKNPIAVWIFSLLGLLFLYVVTIGVCGGLCRMIYKELTEEAKLSITEALDFSRANWVSLIFSPVVLGLILIGILILEIILSFLGALPQIGEILLALLTVPLLIVNVLLILAALSGGILTLAIVAVEAKNVSETLKKIYELILKAPIELISYLAVSGLFAYMVIGGVVGVYILSLILTGGLFWPVVQKLVNAFSVGIAVPISLQIAGIITGLSLAIATAVMVAYLIVSGQALATLIYLAIREKLARP